MYYDYDYTPKMKRSDIFEDSIWLYTCSNCGSKCEIREDPDYMKDVTCDYCAETFILEADK